MEMLFEVCVRECPKMLVLLNCMEMNVPECDIFLEIAHESCK